MIFLICFSPLSILRDDDLSVEVNPRRSPGYAFEKLAGIAMRNIMMHIHGYLHSLILSAHINTV